MSSSVLLLLLLLLLSLIGATAVNSTSSPNNVSPTPTPTPAPTPTLTPTSPSPSANPFVKFPTADIRFAILNASRPSYVAPINGVVPSSIWYIQVDVVTASSPSPVKVQLNLINRDGTTQSWFGTLVSSTSSYVVIRPGLTGQACAAAARGAGSLYGSGCNFTLQVTATTITTPQDIQVTSIRASARTSASQVTASTTFPNVVVYGVELSSAALSAGVPLSLLVSPSPGSGSSSSSSSSSPRALDLWVAHETQVDSPLYPDNPSQQVPKSVSTDMFVLNSTSVPFTSLSKTAPLSTSLFLLAVVPTVNDTTSRAYVLTVGGPAPATPTDAPQTGATTPVLTVPASYVISFVILAGIAMLGFCCFAMYLIAKRRRERLQGVNQATVTDTGGALTSGRVVEAQPPPPGVTPQELELIPIHTEPPKSETDEALCSVCLSSYDSSQCQSLRTLACGHCYHVTCIDPWLQQHRTCPYCRVDAIPEQTRKGTGTRTNTGNHTPTATPRSTAQAPSLPPSRVRMASVHSPATVSPGHGLASSPSSPSRSQSPYYVQEANRDSDMPDNRV